MIEVEEMTIEQVRDLLYRGELTSKALVMFYLERIAKYDKGERGLNAILELNPEALQMADQLDEERKQCGPRSILHGIPILIKDNISTKDHMHTSGGSLALADLYVPFDAFIIDSLSS